MPTERYELVRVYTTEFRWPHGFSYSSVPEAEVESARNPAHYRARRDADHLMALLVRHPWAAYATVKDYGLQLERRGPALAGRG
jgi:hypothetical protein